MDKDHEDKAQAKKEPRIENRYRHPDDQPLRASVNEIQNFMEDNPVWADMVEWMKDRKELLKTGLRQANSMEDVRGIQRALDQIDDIMELPEWFLEEQKEEQRSQKQRGN